MDATLHIRLDKDLKHELEKHAEAYDIKLSNVIRIALEEFAYKDHEITTIPISKINSDRF
jgi:antitoxin component of RelBE/YafQ-DinJ toxin-antitoxin module